MCVHSIDFPMPLINMHNSLIITENYNLYRTMNKQTDYTKDNVKKGDF